MSRNLESIAMALENKHNWTPVIPKEYEIELSVAIPGNEVYNRLNNERYIVEEPNTLIATGAFGEKWLLPMAKAMKEYDFEAKNIVLNGKAVAKTKSPADCLAGYGVTAPTHFVIRVPENISGDIKFQDGIVLSVNIKENDLGENIEHGQGDLIVCAAKNGKFDFAANMKVVNGCLAECMYEIVGEMKNIEEISLMSECDKLLFDDFVEVEEEPQTDDFLGPKEPNLLRFDYNQYDSDSNRD